MAGTRVKKQPKTDYNDVEEAEKREAPAGAEQGKVPQPLDTAAVQAEILNLSEMVHEFDLLDGTHLAFRMGVTLRDFQKHRIDGKIMILVARLSEAAVKFPQVSQERAFTAAILDNETIQDEILFIVGKLCNVKPDVFIENISAQEIARLGLLLMTILANNQDMMKTIFPNQGASQAKN